MCDCFFDGCDQIMFVWVFCDGKLVCIVVQIDDVVIYIVGDLFDIWNCVFVEEVQYVCLVVWCFVVQFYLCGWWYWVVVCEGFDCCCFDV